MNARDEVFRIIDQQVRQPAVAQIGGFRPEPGLRSRFGGRFYLPRGLAWPSSGGRPMTPLLQVVTAELPAVTSELEGVDVVQVFVGQDLPVQTPVFGGPGFAVLGFMAGGLEPRDCPFDYACPRPFEIRWSAGRPEGPSWGDASRFLTHELTMEYVKAPDCFEAYYDRYAPCHSTKVGGWPAYIQGAPELLEGFALQIDSEEKPRWMLGDNGNLYFYRRGSEWGVHGDCY